MKNGLRAVLLQALAMIMAASIAQAHTVPESQAFDDGEPELAYLRDNGYNEEANGVAEYCKSMQIPLGVCVGRLGRDPAAAKAASDCAKTYASESAFDPTIAHAEDIGKNPKTGQEEYMYHIATKYTQELGWHRHDWGVEARRMAGFEMAGKYVEAIKQAWDGISSSVTKEISASLQLDLAHKLQVQFGFAADEAVAQAKAMVEGKAQATDSQKGPPETLIKQIWELGMNDGQKAPWKTSVSPDQLWQYAGDKDHHPKSDTKPLYEPNTSDTAKPDEAAKQPPPSNPDSCKSDDTQWPDPSPMSKNPGTVSVSPDSALTISKLESCQAKKYKSWLQQGYDYSQSEDGDTRTRREKAEEALNHGACDPAWYGAQFCANFNAKKSMIEANPNDQPATPPQKTAAEIKAEKDALTTEVSQPDSTAGATLGFDALCSDPKTSAKTKALMGCSGQTSSGTGEDLWCSDPRATDEEKTALGCFGYGKTSLPDPYAPPSTDDASSDPVPAGMIPPHIDSPGW